MGTIEERFWARVDKDGPVVRPELGMCYGVVEGTIGFIVHNQTWLK